MNIERTKLLRDLRLMIAQYFNVSELQDLVFYLDADWEELRGDTKSEKILSLIIYLGQNHSLSQITPLLRQKRPHLNWPDLPDSIPWLAPKPTTREGRFRQALLEKVRLVWIKGLLEHTIPEDTFLNLELQLIPDQVERPWQMSVSTTSDQTAHNIVPTEKPFLELFTETSGAMLILGEPGSGKTTLLLKLAQDLLDIAELDESQPVPIVFNLSSWARKRQSLNEWIIEELFISYQVSKNFSRSWLEKQPFRILLDGLDEVKKKHRDQCVTAINEFHQNYGLIDIVVAGRTKDYTELTTKLELMGAVQVNPLSLKQADAFLAAHGEKLAAVREAVQHDEFIQSLVRSPLTLRILSIAYQGKSANELKAATFEQQQNKLWEAYIKYMFAYRGWQDSSYSRKEAKKWLSWLAYNQKKHAQTIFYTERLQLDWLPFKFQLLVGSASGVIPGLYAWWFAGLRDVDYAGLNLYDNRVIVGLLFGLINAYNAIRNPQDKNPVAAISWDWKKGLSSGLPFLLIGLFISMFFWPIIGMYAFDFMFGIVVTTREMYLIVSGIAVIIGIFGGLQQKDLDKKLYPNQGLRLSIFYATIFAGLAALIEWGLYKVVFNFVCTRDGALLGLTTAQLCNYANYAILAGAVGILYIWLKWGGEFIIYHIALRTVLTITNDLPRQLLGFLDDMVDHSILRKIGGGYIFLHRALMEYFSGLKESRFD